MRGERHAVVVDVGQPLLAVGDDVVGLDPLGVHREHLPEPGAQRQHLESAAVGERRSGPVHERAQTAGLVDDVGARLQVQVIGVGQNSLRAKFFHRFGQHGLDGGLGADGDERRRVDVAVRSADDAGAPEPPGQFRIDTEERLTHDVYSINPEKRAATGSRSRRFCRVINRLVVVAAAGVVAGGIAGCSSGPPPAEPQPGTLVAGTAQVTVNGQDTGTTEPVQCMPAGTLTTITTGDNASGVTAMVSNKDELIAESVSINNCRRLHRQLQRRAGRHREGHDDRPNVRHHRDGRRFQHRQSQLPRQRHLRDQGVLLTA